MTLNPFDPEQNPLMNLPPERIETGPPAIGLPLVMLEIGVILFLAAVLT